MTAPGIIDTACSSGVRTSTSWTLPDACISRSCSQSISGMPGKDFLFDFSYIASSSLILFAMVLSIGHAGARGACRYATGRP